VTVPTWIVWSVAPPECAEQVSCASVLDAARAWAERQFQRGVLPRDGTEVMARQQGDALPGETAYRLRISIAAAPAFRARMVGLAFEMASPGGRRA